MTSTVDIDEKIYQRIKHNSMSISAPPYPKVGNMIINVRQLIESTKSLIREVAEEVIGEYEDSGKIEWHGEEDARIAGRDDLRSEQRTKLNNILGKEK